MLRILLIISGILICFNCLIGGESKKRNIEKVKQSQSKSQRDNYNQDYSTLVSDSIIYEFINFVIEDRYKNEPLPNGKCKYIVDNFPNVINAKDSLELIRLDKIFTHSDLDFIFKQNELRSSFFIKTNFLKANFELIQKDSLDKYILNSPVDNFDDYFKRYGRYGFLVVGLPLFSKDLKTAIIYISIHQSDICGERRKVIYKRISNKWKVIHILDSVIF
jgi:hypothetical protein